MATKYKQFVEINKHNMLYNKDTVIYHIESISRLKNKCIITDEMKQQAEVSLSDLVDSIYNGLCAVKNPSKLEYTFKSYEENIYMIIDAKTEDLIGIVNQFKLEKVVKVLNKMNKEYWIKRIHNVNIIKIDGNIMNFN